MTRQDGSERVEIEGCYYLKINNFTGIKTRNPYVKKDGSYEEEWRRTGGSLESLRKVLCVECYHGVFQLVRLQI